MNRNDLMRITAVSRRDRRPIIIGLPAFVVETLQQFTVGPHTTGQLILNIHRGTIGSVQIKQTGPPAELDD